MIIAVASGKGGTGKTTLSIALSLVSNTKICLLDCDVEEPNCSIFLKPKIVEESIVTVPKPEINLDKCNGCGKCVEICQFNALAMVNTKPMAFLELCHSCGGCQKVCPSHAIQDTPYPIGTIKSGVKNSIEFYEGSLYVGQSLSTPLIRAVKSKSNAAIDTIIDCPPGTSCPVVAAISHCDYVILVTEPTPFGLHDLTLAVKTAEEMKLPFGVVINRAGTDDHSIYEYCHSQQIKILAEIPHNRKITEAYSKGENIIQAVPELAQTCQNILQSIKNQTGVQ